MSSIKDFRGNPLTIKKTGVIYPVDVELRQIGDKNVLSISTKVNFVDCVLPGYENLKEWKEAIFAGFKEWEGEYQVFGDQPLTVTVDVCETEKLIDCIIVYGVSDDMRDSMAKTFGKLNLEQKEQICLQGRSFSGLGFLGVEWKTYLPRFLFLQQQTLDDLQYAKIVAKHEFGHVLGLGDLYYDLSVGLCGVDGAEYSDIEPYYLGDHTFDMVMCNNGPVRNNDIEMVILAFSTNSFQNYQAQNNKKKISDALGNGN